MLFFVYFELGLKDTATFVLGILSLKEEYKLKTPEDKWKHEAQAMFSQEFFWTTVAFRERDTVGNPEVNRVRQMFSNSCSLNPG